MAGTRIEIDDRDVRLSLDRLAHAAAHMRPFFLEAGEELIQSTDARFDEAEAPDGAPWAPLSEKYLRSKRKRSSKGAAKILQLDLKLRSTLAYQATDRDLAVGTSRIYGATHQFGDLKRGIPQREWLGLSASDRAMLFDLVQEYFERSSGFNLGA